MDNTINWLAIIGLCFDIIGAILIAKPIFMRSKEEIIDNSYRGSGRVKPDLYNHVFGGTRIYAQCHENRMVRFGLFLLCSGFALQGISIFKFTTNINFSILFVTLIFLIVAYFIIRKKHRNELEEIALEIYCNFVKLDRVINLNENLPEEKKMQVNFPANVSRESFNELMNEILPHIKDESSKEHSDTKSPANKYIEKKARQLIYNGQTNQYRDWGYQD